MQWASHYSSVGAGRRKTRRELATFYLPWDTQLCKLLDISQIKHIVSAENLETDDFKRSIMEPSREISVGNQRGKNNQPLFIQKIFVRLFLENYSGEMEPGFSPTDL